MTRIVLLLVAVVTAAMARASRPPNQEAAAICGIKISPG